MTYTYAYTVLIYYVYFIFQVSLSIYIIYIIVIIINITIIKGWILIKHSHTSRVFLLPGTHEAKAHGGRAASKPWNARRLKVCSSRSSIAGRDMSRYDKTQV